MVSDHCLFPDGLRYWSRKDSRSRSVNIAPMRLLEPTRLVRDEGVGGALRFVWNLLRDSEARERVLEMRSVFRRQRKQLGAVAITAIKH